MRNKFNDLNDILFAQLNKLTKGEAMDDRLKLEIERSRAVTDVAKRMIENGRLSLDALKLKAEYEGLPDDLPLMLGDGKANRNGHRKKT